MRVTVPLLLGALADFAFSLLEPPHLSRADQKHVGDLLRGSAALISGQDLISQMFRIRRCHPWLLSDPTLHRKKRIKCNTWRNPHTRRARYI